MPIITLFVVVLVVELASTGTLYSIRVVLPVVERIGRVPGEHDSGIYTVVRRAAGTLL